MKSVNIADLKNNLSRYLRQVRRGEEILIRDRKVPVAKIVPLSTGEGGEELAQLAAEGLIRLRENKLDIDEFWAMPGPRLPLKRVVAAIVADREDD
ncbi:MAG: type II toxin-antitoxin system Phd/YefM family antitoxin [Gammaproteobacteria bacterium]